MFSLAKQQRRIRRGLITRGGGQCVGKPLRHVVCFVDDGVQKSRVHGSRIGTGCFLQHTHLELGRAKRLAQLIGHRQDIGGISPTGLQTKGRHGPGLRKVCGEIRQVRRTRPAPAIDRLEWVSHTHHRVIRKERLQQGGLQHAGVLILIQEHDAVSLAHLLGDVGGIAYDLET